MRNLYYKYFVLSSFVLFLCFTNTSNIFGQSKAIKSIMKTIEDATPIAQEGYIKDNGDANLLLDAVEILLKNRHLKNSKISFTYNVNEQLEVYPMLLLPIIENSFKHGLGKDRSNGFVKVLIVTHEDDLHFEIVNSKPSTGSEISQQAGYQGGIGLINVKKRLNLLYPKQHALELKSTETEFKVSLDIKLT